MEQILKQYSNEKITIIWKPALCQHMSFCWKELPEVFNPNERPWIDPYGASSERIIKQVERCPTGALSYRNNSDKIDAVSEEPERICSQTPFVEVLKNGPLLVHGDIFLVEGEKKTCKKDRLSLCRCGASKNKPYCDGSHVEIGFEG
jgi:uncharacterized Fe-S cluster protein YjdI